MTATPESETPTLLDVIRAVVAADRAGLHTSMPGQIKSYDAATQTATVQPMMRVSYVDSAGDRQTEALAPIANVPVVFPRGGGFFISFPLADGDGVDLAFSESQIAAWRDTGDISDPGDGLHGFFGAKAYPGLETIARKLADASATRFVLGKDGGPHIEIDGTTVYLGDGSAANFVALANLVTAQLSALKSAISGAGVLAGDGGATFKAAIIAALGGWPASVAATKVKAT